MIQVVIVDDHPLIREGVKKVLNSAHDLEVIGEAADGKELMALLKNKQPDIVILDINMPGRSGLEVLKDLQEWYPDLPALVLSMHSEKRMALRSFKSGAWGYMNKTSINKDMIDAIRKITLQKRRYINPETAEQLAREMSEGRHVKPHEKLSDREFQIMRYLAKGIAVTKIAEELSLSTQTIYTYRDRVKEKLNLDSNVAIARYAIEHDLSG